MTNETNFDLHENYSSIEELEQAMQKVHDAAVELTNSMIDSKLPPCISFGIVDSIISSFKHVIKVDAQKKSELESLLEFLSKIKED